MSYNTDFYMHRPDWNTWNITDNSSSPDVADYYGSHDYHKYLESLCPPMICQTPAIEGWATYYDSRADPCHYAPPQASHPYIDGQLSSNAFSLPQSMPSVAYTDINHHVSDKKQSPDFINLLYHTTESSEIATKIKTDRKSSIRRKRKEGSYPCETCGRIFRQRFILTRHQLIHAKEKPFICTICQKGFSDKSTYNKHLRIHTGLKPYSCHVCKKTFSQSGNMRRHMRVMHSPTSQVTTMPM